MYQKAHHGGVGRGALKTRPLRALQWIPRQADRCNRPLAEVLEAPHEQLPVRSVAGRGHRPAGRPRCALACPRLRPGRANLRVPHRPRDLASLLPRPGRARARAARSRRRGRPGDERPGDGPRRREGAPRSRPLRGDAPSRGARRPGAGGTPSPAASGRDGAAGPRRRAGRRDRPQLPLPPARRSRRAGGESGASSGLEGGSPFSSRGRAARSCAPPSRAGRAAPRRCCCGAACPACTRASTRQGFRPCSSAPGSEAPAPGPCSTATA